MSRLLIVSNRLPIKLSMIDGRPELTPSTGGLAMGLKGPHERSGGLWFGWPGDLSRLRNEHRRVIERELSDLRAVPVEISHDEFEGYYTQISNGVLWPLFHHLVDRIPYRNPGWNAYQAVNQRFADTVCEHYRTGDLVWVHDYQLALVPSFIRARIPTARVGFFLHIPFPSSEVFRLLPWREVILRGMLGADVVGFHTFSYVRQFINTLILTLGIMPIADRVDVGGRRVKLGVYPMGVDAAAFEAQGQDPDVLAEATRLRCELGQARLLLGVDRLDYTKGIPRRLLAIEHLLESDPTLRSSIRFVQVAVPSRADVPEYELFTGEVQQLIGRINGRFSTPLSVPIHFLHQSFSQRELAAFYLAADVMLVTPLRDGMNLVAKEFVATRVDGDGVLVLSEFAGAASEMGEAVLVNPYDVSGTAEAIARTLKMRPSVRQTRMKALRERILTYDVRRWVDEFLGDLESHEECASAPTVTLPPLPAALGDHWSDTDGVLWLLDYDGTLVPLVERPEFAEPDAEILEILSTLAGNSRMAVHIISGRAREVLEEWLGSLNIGLHAEHGLWSRQPGGPWQANLKTETGWKEVVRPVLKDFAVRTPGALVEEKGASLAFHYRMADIEYGEWQARELKIHLAHVLSNMPLEILPGNKVVEVRPHGVNKGLVVPTLLARLPNALVVAAGDDHTDESLFQALPRNAVSISVGNRSTGACFSVANPEALRALLRAVIAHNSDGKRASRDSV